MHFLFDTLFPIRYLITLKENTNRHRHFKEQLSIADVGNVSVVLSRKVLFRTCFKNTASRSVTEAHLKVHRMALAQGGGNVLILEDDIVFAEGFKARLEPVLRDLQAQDWDMFYFFRPQKGNADLSGRRGEVLARWPSGLLKITGTINTHAYAIRRETLAGFVGRYHMGYIRTLHPQARIVDKSIPSLALNFFAVDADMIGQSDKFESATKTASAFSGMLENVKRYITPVGNRILRP